MRDCHSGTSFIQTTAWGAAIAVQWDKKGTWMNALWRLCEIDMDKPRNSLSSALSCMLLLASAEAEEGAGCGATWYEVTALMRGL